MLEVGDIDRLPGSRLRRRVEELEGHLSRGRDEEHAQVAPDDLYHENASIGQNRVPGLGLGLEALVTDARPLKVNSAYKGALTSVSLSVSCP